MGTDAYVDIDTTCPGCSRYVNTSGIAERPPDDRQRTGLVARTISICGHCNKPCYWNENMQLVLFSPEELQELKDQQPALHTRLEAFIQKRHIESN